MRIGSYEGQIETEKLSGCQACIVRLPCGGKIATHFISVQGDSASFKNKSVLKLDAKLTGPLRYLIETLPPIGELSQQANIETAETSLLEEVQNRVARSSTMTPEITNDNIEEKHDLPTENFVSPCKTILEELYRATSRSVRQ